MNFFFIIIYVNYYLLFNFLFNILNIILYYFNNLKGVKHEKNAKLSQMSPNNDKTGLSLTKAYDLMIGIGMVNPF